LDTVTAWSAEELVYDRALFDGTGTGVGDRHLAAVFPVHGRMMNAGTSSAEDCYSAEQILRAADGFAYFGLVELAEVVRRIPGTDFGEGRESRLNRAYYGLVDMDLALIAGFQRKYAASPEDFDPPPSQPSPRGLRTQVDLPRAEPTEPVNCQQLLTIHQLASTCADTSVCGWPERYAYHYARTLHREPGCDLCPHGPTWAD
jgi:hypothetical protein